MPKLNSQQQTPPIYFNLIQTSRLGQILHARLRLECSSLNHHLYRKNLVESPLCACSPLTVAGTFKQVAQRATIAHLSPMCQGQISFQKIQTHPSFNACSCYMKVSKGSNQKQQRKSGNTIFPIIRSIGVFLRRSRAANSVVGGPIWPKFELIHNIIRVLVTSKFEKDRININRDYVMTSIF